MQESPEKNFKKTEQIVSPEKKEIMEGAHAERLEIISSSFSRMVESAYSKVPQPIKSAASVGGNFIPIIAELKMFTEGVKGKTSSGRELNNTDRVMQLVAATTSALGKILGMYAVAEGNTTLGTIAATTYAASWGATLYSSGKETIAGFKSIIETIKSKLGEDVFKQQKGQQNE